MDPCDSRGGPGQAWWLTPVIPALWEAEEGRSPEVLQCDSERGSFNVTVLQCMKVMVNSEICSSTVRLYLCWLDFVYSPIIIYPCQQPRNLQPISKETKKEVLESWPAGSLWRGAPCRPIRRPRERGDHEGSGPAEVPTLLQLLQKRLFPVTPREPQRFVSLKEAVSHQGIVPNTLRRSPLRRKAQNVPQKAEGLYDPGHIGPAIRRFYESSWWEDQPQEKGIVY
ncbi:uncharacterized protein [Symphalangus syndactylus]|uniref:uncharacterized protein n=1 Tax=Symphalangus syndactylus TaxID=9590 RepID=UPI0030060D26